MISKTKKIRFQSDKATIEVLPPIPSSRLVPAWYRKMKGVTDRVETVKKCVPVLDALTAGYMIPLTADLSWDSETQKFSSQGRIELVSGHIPSQTEDVSLPPEYATQPYKWINSWYIKTPPGYSTLFIHPLNRMDLPFYSFTGIVDTDKHPLVINFPFVFRKDFSGTIPAGTPLIQAIPFKRDNWETVMDDSGRSYSYQYEYEVEQPPFAWYKRKWWTKKIYG